MLLETFPFGCIQAARDVSRDVILRPNVFRHGKYLKEKGTRARARHEPSLDDSG